MGRMLPWDVRDVSSWLAGGEEPRGRREKRWVRDFAGSQWLRKTRTDARPYEPSIEALMLRLGQQVGIPAPDSYVCEWIDGDTRRQGILIRLFLDDQTEELTLGAALLEQHDPAIDSQSPWTQTLALVRQALCRLEPASELLRDFARMIVFDGWIGNADRHQENWGVITPANGPRRLAPMFDPASCLGAELQEGNKHLLPSVTAESLSRDARNCGSGFGDGLSSVRLESVIEELRLWPEWKAHAHSWVAEFPAAMDTLKAFLHTVPSIWLPEHRKRFMLNLLQGSLERSATAVVDTASERLFVLWGEPADGTRRVIGELWRDTSGFAFGYGHQIDVAIERGFRLLPEFPILCGLEAPYRSSCLFGTFAQRIPSPKRPDYGQIIASWGVTATDSQLEILANSGGVQVTDRIELSEYRASTDSLERPLLFRIAGTKHYAGAAHLKVGQPVLLIRESQNLYDAQAVAVIAASRQQVGHVPRQYSDLIARLVDGGIPLEASVKRWLAGPGEGGRWLISVTRAGVSERQSS